MIIPNANETVPFFGLLKIIYAIESLLCCLEDQLYETLGLNRNLLASEVAVPALAQATELSSELSIHHIIQSLCDKMQPCRCNYT